MEEPEVLRTDETDETARLTVAIDDERHKFSASVEERDGHTRAELEYEETLGYRGETRVGEPHDHVWEALFASDELLEWIAQTEADTVRRAR